MKNKAKTTTKKHYVLTVKMSPALGKQLQDFAVRSDSTSSDVVKASIRRTIREGSVPIEPDLVPTPYLEKIIKKADADYKAGKNIVGPFSTDEDIRNYLESL